MRKHSRILWAALFLTGVTSNASAVTVVLDLNGFPNITGGQVYGAGLKEPIALTAGKQRIELPALQAGSTYQVDFFHNSGENSSDFAFTVNAAGTGVETVAPAAKKFTIVKDFKPGSATLKLNTHTITYNANSGQTGTYYIHGLLAPIQGDKGPIKLAAMPGLYRVDNLYNSGQGNEDFSFIVDSDGKTSATGGNKEYAEFSGSTVSPRSVKVHFQIWPSSPIAYHGTQKVLNAKSANNVYELDMLMTVGSSGLNIWSFGRSKVLKSDVVAPDGKPLQDKTGVNDFHFYPRLRYDSKKGFFFESTVGPSGTSGAEVTGSFDDGKTDLQVTVDATIQTEKAAAK